MRGVSEVNEAAAVVQRMNTPEASIVGYFTSNGKERLIEELQAQLRAHLPEFMVPSHLVSLPQLPYLPNGKLDRGKLEQYDVVREVRSDTVQPSTDLERAIAEIWSSLLRVEDISTTDNFFELGGHSLMAIQAIDAIEKGLGVRLNPRRMLTNTLEQLAKDCEGATKNEEQKRGGLLGRLFARGALRDKA